jgi:S-formylglutathione hydrolase FrmB
MEKGTITSSALMNNLYGDPATRSVRVYLPPSYDTSSRRYPVVYALHGYLNDETQLAYGGTSDYGTAKSLQAALDKMIWERSIGEMIVVFPNATNKLFGSFYLSSPVIGDYETYIVKDLVELIDTRYRTLPTRESRAVTGFSMGGWGTMHLALKFPDVFSVAVAEAGRYNSRSQQADALSRELARFHPTNFTQYMAMGDVDYMLCTFQALFAGLLPNPQRPDLYTDYPYEWVNGQPVLSESADQRCRQGDVQNGDLPCYRLQPIRLNGIKIIHGTADTASPVIHAREFTNALHLAGMQFEYEEHSGGHEYRAALALPFLSSHLQGAERYIAPARLTVSLAANGLQLVFSTQTNVQYTVESAATLDTSGGNWTERTRLTGNGQTATVESPRQGEAQFFRIRAANVP